jgi:hypothetical protein
MHKDPTKACTVVMGKSPRQLGFPHKEAGAAVCTTFQGPLPGEQLCDQADSKGGAGGAGLSMPSLDPTTVFA